MMTVNDEPDPGFHCKVIDCGEAVFVAAWGLMGNKDVEPGIPQKIMVLGENGRPLADRQATAPELMSRKRCAAPSLSGG